MLKLNVLYNAVYLSRSIRPNKYPKIEFEIASKVRHSLPYIPLPFERQIQTSLRTWLCDECSWILSSFFHLAGPWVNPAFPTVCFLPLFSESQNILLYKMCYNYFNCNNFIRGWVKHSLFIISNTYFHMHLRWLQKVHESQGLYCQWVGRPIRGWKEV